MGNVEREITEPVDLCDARGRLSPSARGWSRHPMLGASAHACGRPTPSEARGACRTSVEVSGRMPIVGVLKMEVHQCFGTWSGRIVGDDGVPTTISGIRGFAEEARNRMMTTTA